jgi:hypothetical protein
MYVDNSQEFRVLAPFALRDLIFNICLSICVSAGVMASAAAQENGGGRSKAISFDIPSEPLAQALDAYARTTGMAALVDQELIRGYRSALVKGLLTPDQALRILLAGTNLSPHYANDSAFTLAPTDILSSSEPSANVKAGDLHGLRQAYFAQLQNGLAGALCRRPESRLGRYRLGLQLWIGANGAILASHLLDSTGDEQRDAIIADLLESTTVAPPPSDLPQPVTVVLLVHPAEQTLDCRENGRHPG